MSFAFQMFRPMKMRKLSTSFLTTLPFAVMFISSKLMEVSSHGRLMDPPSRSSLWRIPEFHHLPLEPNYEDNQLFCGGAYIQHGRNGGKCGECGDAYHLKRPRDNESGGKYGKGIITRTYSKGQVITARVEITANHNGHFEFKLCPMKEMYSLVEQSCLDKYPLKDYNTGKIKHTIANSVGWHNFSLQLPPRITCGHCVFQWHYRAANSWGDCGNGTGAVGCGPQETFRGCSDIRIM